MYTEDVSVVGLGNLGVCLAASLADAGFSVTGIDKDDEIVGALQDGSAPVPEPSLQEYIDRAGDRLQATTDIDGHVADSDMSFVVVNTPSTEEDRYSLEDVTTVCEAIGRELPDTDGYHTVVITSTVFPGATTGEIKDVLEETSGLTAGEDFGLCYSPEFIAIGDVIRGLEDPDFFLIGEYDQRAGERLSTVYDRASRGTKPIVRIDPVDAEIAKLAVNSYLTTKISFANTLGQICTGMDADIDAVTDAIGLDSRISDEYFTAGGRFGGPCFPRDNDAFSRLALDAGTEAPIATSTDEVNDIHTDWIADIVSGVTRPSGTIAVLGLTYKPNTYITTESQGIDLVETFQSEFDVLCYDPMAQDEEWDRLNGRISFIDAASDAVAGADTVVLTCPWEGLLDESIYADTDITLVDVWRKLNPVDLGGEVSYIPLGRGAIPETASVDR